MSKPPTVRWPDAGRKDLTPFEKFKRLAERLVHVPKREIDERAECYRESQAKKQKK